MTADTSRDFLGFRDEGTSVFLMFKVSCPGYTLKPKKKSIFLVFSNCSFSKLRRSCDLRFCRDFSPVKYFWGFGLSRTTNYLLSRIIN